MEQINGVTAAAQTAGNATAAAGATAGQANQFAAAGDAAAAGGGAAGGNQELQNAFQTATQEAQKTLTTTTVYGAILYALKQRVG